MPRKKRDSGAATSATSAAAARKTLAGAPLVKLLSLRLWDIVRPARQARQSV